jgi:cubilin
VALYDGPNDTSPLITKNCGQNMPNPDTYASTGNQMYVRLMADGSVAGKGFKANYSMVNASSIYSYILILILVIHL